MQPTVAALRLPLSRPAAPRAVPDRRGGKSLGNLRHRLPQQAVSRGGRLPSEVRRVRPALLHRRPGPSRRSCSCTVRGRAAPTAEVMLTAAWRRPSERKTRISRSSRSSHKPAGMRAGGPSPRVANAPLAILGAGAIRVSRRHKSGHAHGRFHGRRRNLESRCGRTGSLVGDRADLPRRKDQHGGALKDIPCWCFHGDADEVIPVSQSREMVRAIQEAGGKPLYQEFIGVDHNSCCDRAYAMPELFEWLLLQDCAKR